MIILALFASGIILTPNTAHAQEATVPIGTSFDFNNIMTHLKDFVLDKLAYLVAKQILHQMTASIVNWINSGFQGNPSFINNPAGFFEDAADQVTGNFLTGPLQALCSPFSLDIRLALATQQTNSYQQRYACTLSQVIAAQQQTLARAQNGTLVNVSAGMSPNGATIGSIANGDILHSTSQLSVNGSSVSGLYNGFTNNFDQDGGWPGWIALTSEQQNNMYGAYLMAQSDLEEQIAAKKASIDSDLNRGNGFLSYQSCSNVSAAQASQAASANGGARAQQQLNAIQQSANNQSINYQIQNIGASPVSNQLGLTLPVGQASTQNLNIGNGTTIQSSVNTDGSVTYQDCQTVTPGSVIAGTLQTAVNSPIVEAELANDINSVLNALVTQMIGTMLNQGLSGLSSSGSGKNGRSYTQSVIDDTRDKNNNAAANANKEVRDQLLSSTSGLETYKGIYDQAVSVIADSKNQLLSAEACYTNKMASSTAALTQTDIQAGQTKVADISSYISMNVDPLLSTLTGIQSAAEQQIEALTNATTTALDFNTADNSTDSIQNLIDQVQSQVDQASDVASTSISAGETVARGTQQANSDLTNAQKQAKKFNDQAQTYQTACNGFPANASNGISAQQPTLFNP